jgi:hypothetical protein
MTRHYTVITLDAGNAHDIQVELNESAEEGYGNPHFIDAGRREGDLNENEAWYQQVTIVVSRMEADHGTD